MKISTIFLLFLFAVLLPDQGHASDAAAPKAFVYAQVVAVLPEGLLVHSEESTGLGIYNAGDGHVAQPGAVLVNKDSIPPAGVTRIYGTVLIKNHPKQQSAVDGDWISCVCYADGRFQDQDGGTYRTFDASPAPSGSRAQ